MKMFNYKNITSIGFIILVYMLPIYAFAKDSRPIPSTCQQAILVITDSINATCGNLYFFERELSKAEWNPCKTVIPISLGRNGLAWGIGLHDIPNPKNYPIKKEGDGKSPAGIFTLSSVFGHKSFDQMTDLKMPYIHITEMTECIDDAASDYYNSIISRDKIQEQTEVDWNSSEKMIKAKICYELGVVVDHNTDPITKSSGSCIFLHIWSKPFETTAGCTVMTPQNMKEVVYWLDKSKHPILIQLTKQSYLDLMESWELPKISSH